MKKKKIRLPIVVEGRYDKATLSSIFDARIIELGGFSVFNSKEKQQLLRMLAKSGGIILLTDSDGGGIQLRSFISGILKKDEVHHLYIPEIKGKERRKSAPSRAGLLGVEGMSREVLEKVLSPFVDEGACDENAQKNSKREVTKLDFFNDGLSGGKGSSEKRSRLAVSLGLPSKMSANALLNAINLIYSYEEYSHALEGAD